jgi:hypothetical protein
MSCEPQVPLSSLKRAEAALLVVKRLHWEARAQLARHRRWGRFALAVGLGLLLSPAALTGSMATPTPCPEPELANVLEGGVTDGGATPRPVEGQQRARKAPPYCEPSYAVVVAGYCWLAVEHEPGRCPSGTVPNAGRCLAPVSEKAKAPTSIVR